MDPLPFRKPHWVLTAEAFEKLLGTLGPDRDRAGEQYEILRRKLVKFFAWRGCAFPEDNADEALNRVARRIDEGEQVHDLGSYVAGVARRVALETLKGQSKERRTLDERVTPLTVVPATEADQRRDCLERGLQSLPARSREIVLQYYHAEKRAKIDHRRALAERLGIPVNALRIRVHRIRAVLEQRVADCLEGSSLGRSVTEAGSSSRGRELRAPEEGAVSAWDTYWREIGS